MQLNRKIADSRPVGYVIRRIPRPSKIDDVIRAYNLFCDLNPNLDEQATARIERVYFNCRNMYFDAPDVINMLLCHDYLAQRATLEKFRQFFGEDRYKGYYGMLEEVCRNAPDHEGWTREECVFHEIMMRMCDNNFNSIYKQANKNRTPIVDCSKAYNKAKKLLLWERGIGGEPSLAHYVRMAGILYEFGVESPIVAAAMLCDAVEAKEDLLEDGQPVCGEKAVRLIGVYKALEEQCKGAITATSDGYDMKLTEIEQDNEEIRFALYIKAADIIDELGCAVKGLETAFYKQAFLEDAHVQRLLEVGLVPYTEMLRKYRLSYFLEEIEAILWCAADIDRYVQLQTAYDEMCFYNKEYMNTLGKLLAEHTAAHVNRYVKAVCADDEYEGGFDVSIYPKELSPYELYHHIQSKGGTSAISLEDVDKRFIPICDYYIVADPKSAAPSLRLDLFLQGFVKMFESKIADKGFTITKFYRNSDDEYALEAEDCHRNLYRCKMILRSDYEERRKGVYATKAAALYVDDGESSEMIRIRLSDGAERYMPKGACIIDVAFEIHEAIGLTAQAAYVNDIPQKLSYKVQEGDRIVIVADSTQTPPVPRVRINWLKWVRTKKARYKIIEYLNRWYGEGDDPKDESRAKTYIVDKVSDKIWDNMGGSGIG